MKKFRNALAAVLAAVSAFIMLMPAYSAISIFDNAEPVVNGRFYTRTAVNNGDFIDVAVNAPEDGNLTVTFTESMRWMYLYVYDSDGVPVVPDKIILKTGLRENDGRYNWDETSQMCAAEETFSVTKGNYYIRFDRNGIYNSGEGWVRFTVTVPQYFGDIKEDSQDSGDGRYIYDYSVTLKAGQKIQLSAFDFYDDFTYSKSDVKWTSSNKNVARVSKKGTVKAYRRGRSYISARYGGQTKIILVKVVN